MEGYGQIKFVFLLVQSSSIEPKCFGSGHKPEPAQNSGRGTPATIINCIYGG